MQTEEIQRALLAWGFDVDKFAADGDFGGDTLKALKAFQKANGLTDGIGPDPQTIMALRAAQPIEQRMSAIGLTALIAREERRLTAYLDSVGNCTIGIGRAAAAGLPSLARGCELTWRY